MTNKERYQLLTKQMRAAGDAGNFKKAIAIQRERNKIAVQYQKEHNLIWNQEKWITEIMSDNFNSYEKARQDLLDKLKDLPGVEVINGGKGVKTIRVTSDYSIYDYEIKAHNGYIEQGVKHQVDVFTGELEEVPNMVPVVYASLGKNIYKAYRNVEDFNVSEYEN